MNAAVKAQGVNGITRACFVETRFEPGKWHRVYPAKAGTFDCNPRNAVDLSANLLGP